MVPNLTKTPGRLAPDAAQGSALRPGRVMFERYSLQRLLGRGGMGVVWLANDRKLDRLVALKFLPEVFFLDAAARDELKRETRRSLELTHPNVVRIYDFVEDAEAAAISMEFVDGQTLSHMRVERSQRCFEAEGLQAWVSDLCRALDYAHRVAHAVHRDLKPANLMVTTRGVLKVADFGIACGLQNTAARVSAWNSSGGTLGYMSPQQLQGELAAPSDDIYSIGATLYELLTSKPPFYSGDISLQIRVATPEGIADRRRALGVAGEPVPKTWERTVAACLAKSSSDRPGSAGEIVRLLGIDTASLPPLVSSEDMPTAVDFSEVRGGASSALRLASPSVSEQLTVAGPAPSSSVLRMLRSVGVLPWAILGSVFLCGVVIWMLLPHRKKATDGGRPTAAAGVGPTVGGAVQSGGVMVKTDPPGASVTVGAFATGTSPASLRGIPEGAHPVSIQLAGFEPISMNAQVRGNEFTDLGLLSLERSTGTLQLTTEPEDTPYTLLAENGESVIRRGRTPEAVPNLPTGKYLVRFDRDGWPAELRSVLIERQNALVVAERFGTGTLQVTSDPPGAEVVLGDRPLGATPLTIAMPTGHHGPFVAILDGYELISFEADLTPDAVTAIPPLRLKGQPPRLAVETTPPGIAFQLFAGAVKTPDALPIRTGTSPTTVEGLTPGSYRIVFISPPWPTLSTPVEVSERGTTLFEPEFAHGILTATSEPQGAEIFADGKLLGVAPLEVPLPPATYAIMAKQNARSSKPRNIVLASDETEEVRFDFRSGTSSSTKSKSRRSKKPKEEETALTKIGRSLKTFFSGGQRARK